MDHDPSTQLVYRLDHQRVRCAGLTQPHTDTNNEALVIGPRLHTSRRLVLHILFVCTGNICRSPTAERLAIAYAEQLGTDGVAVSSAGVRAVIGHPIHATAALVLQSLGGDASDFAARQLTPRVAAGADLVLTMTAAHRDAVLERTPTLLHRTFTMSEAARLATDMRATTVHDLSALRAHIPRRELADIADPIGQDVAVFERIGTQIADMLLPILDLCRRIET